MAAMLVMWARGVSALPGSWLTINPVKPGKLVSDFHKKEKTQLGIRTILGEKTCKGRACWSSSNYQIVCIDIEGFFADLPVAGGQLFEAIDMHHVAGDWYSVA